eukprot:1183349-Prorocentrum_minimum.AAC.2
MRVDRIRSHLRAIVWTVAIASRCSLPFLCDKIYRLSRSGILSDRRTPSLIALRPTVTKWTGSRLFTLAPTSGRCDSILSR